MADEAVDDDTRLAHLKRMRAVNRAVRYDTHAEDAAIKELERKIREKQQA